MPKISSAKHASKKEAIVEKATRLFRQKGYNATSMRHLAEAVGVEAASLYNHLDSKAELLREICFGIARQFNGHLDIVEASSANQVGKVEQIIRFHITMMLHHFNAVYVSNRDWKHLQDPYLADFLQQRRNYEKRFAAIITAGIEQNECRKMHPQIAVLTILSAVRGLEFWQKSKTDLSPKEVENELVQLLIDGLAV